MCPFPPIFTIKSGMDQSSSFVIENQKEMKATGGRGEDQEAIKCCIVFFKPISITVFPVTRFYVLDFLHLKP